MAVTSKAQSNLSSLLNTTEAAKWKVYSTGSASAITPPNVGSSSYGTVTSITAGGYGNNGFTRGTSLWELTGIGQGSASVTDSFTLTLYNIQNTSTGPATFEVYIATGGASAAYSKVNFTYNGSSVSSVALTSGDNGKTFTISFSASDFSGGTSGGSSNSLLFEVAATSSFNTPLGLLAYAMVPEVSPWIPVAIAVAAYAILLVVKRRRESARAGQVAA